MPDHVLQSFRRDVDLQPTVLGGIADHYEGPDGAAALTALAALRPKRVMFTGMGSSFNAALVAASRLNGAGVLASVRPTSELLHYELASLREIDALVVVSQSGAGVEVAKLMEAGVPCPIVGLSNDPASILATSSRWYLPLRAGHEAAVATKTYTASLGVLWLLADVWTSQQPPSTTMLRTAASRQQSSLSAAGETLPAFVSRLANAPLVTLLARGPGLATAKQVALTWKELLKHRVEAAAVAQFRHGPLETVRPGETTVVIGSGATASWLNRTIRDDVHRAGGEVLWVQDGRLLDYDDSVDEPPSEDDDAFAAFLDTLPLQLLAQGFAEATQIDVSFRHASKVTVVE